MKSPTLPANKQQAGPFTPVPGTVEPAAASQGSPAGGVVFSVDFGSVIVTRDFYPNGDPFLMVWTKNKQRVGGIDMDCDGSFLVKRSRFEKLSAAVDRVLWNYRQHANSEAKRAADLFLGFKEQP